MTLEDRFWSKADRSGGPDACWLWMGARDLRGYGRFAFEGRNAHAHKVALLLSGATFPVRAYACHHCDVKACVNPRHLYVGTHQTNMRDMAARGRAFFQAHPERVPRGERHSKARLTDEAVRAIRARYASGGITQRRLAAEYGVHLMTVARAIRRVSWTHV
jgi:hypothetical protein